MKGVRVPMCKKRSILLDEAFEKLDNNRDELVDMEDLTHWYKSLKLIRTKKEEDKMAQVSLFHL